MYDDAVIKKKKEKLIGVTQNSNWLAIHLLTIVTFAFDGKFICFELFPENKFLLLLTYLSGIKFLRDCFY